MSVSIVQVAQKASVSRMTVTRVMRGDAVRETTRKRVLEAMSKLGYVPSSAARAMRSKDSLRANQASCFAVIFGIDTQKADEFFCEVARGVETKAAEVGLCALQVHWLEDLERSWLRVQSVLAVNGLCGVILVGQFSVDEVQAIQNVVENLIIVDGPVPNGVTAAGVEADNVGGCELALAHLSQAGCKNVVMLAGPNEHYFTKAMQNAERNLKSRFETLKVIHTDYSSKKARSAVGALLQNGYEFDGVFGNDSTCIGAMRALADHKIKVPQQIKIVGFDDVPVCEFFKPSLTSVSIDKKKLGSEAVRALVELVRGKEDVRTLKTVINAELTKRESA